MANEWLDAAKRSMIGSLDSSDPKRIQILALIGIGEELQKLNEQLANPPKIVTVVESAETVSVNTPPTALRGPARIGPHPW